MVYISRTKFQLLFGRHLLVLKAETHHIFLTVSVSDLPRKLKKMIKDIYLRYIAKSIQSVVQTN